MLFRVGCALLKLHLDDLLKVTDIIDAMHIIQKDLPNAVDIDRVLDVHPTLPYSASSALLPCDRAHAPWPQQRARQNAPRVHARVHEELSTNQWRTRRIASTPNFLRCAFALQVGFSRLGRFSDGALSRMYLREMRTITPRNAAPLPRRVSQERR